MVKPQWIIIHHSATPDGPGMSWQAIRKYHTEYNKWRDIGYHAGIDLIGDNYEVLIGRPATVQGAHCPTRNRDSLGVCFIGNYNLHPPPDTMLKFAAYRILWPWVMAYDIPVNAIVPHSRFRQTDCPGSQFDMDKLRGYVSQLVSGVTNVA